MHAESMTILTRHARRNFWVNVLDGCAFIFGISMVSRFTIIPLVVARLSDARWLQGLIPALYYAGWLLPGLFMAPIVAAMPRRKPWIMVATTGERLPFLFIGVLFLTMPNLPSATLLTAFFGLYTIYTISSGLTSIAWQDFIARLIPKRFWGTFFGLQNGLGGILGLGSAAVAGSILAVMPFPQSVGVLSLLCFAAMVVSYVFLGLSVEPPQETIPRQPFVTFLRGIGPLLRRDKMFRIYLICRAAIALGLTGHAFLTATALERFHPPASEVGVFTAALLGAQALANIGLGALADRWGHKQVLEISTAMGLAALVMAVLAPQLIWFVPIFILVGASQAGYQLSGFTLIFAFSSPAERPTYIGVANTALAPVAALGPLLAGWLAAILGYGPVFLMLVAIGIIGMVMLHWQVEVTKRTE